ncbi:paraquat-inducible membrane protein A [Thioclava nitratireducens]|uniref:Paraquat-inducible membrane protein A n=2 Tax=Paracoccaceae TaxID=31989 RepID=A0ABM6IDI7_9RHOB|nr:paraquat-inducible membrane protein A [Thioclava nitratireducens]OWY02787.1 paraquat-inducible membrane protein A [Thioclava sp. F1Mire-8]OWY07680.1 paraquat-inducible membrane protein A [Thioclava sp. F42-5]PWE50278.1 paraquat-inducible membrane protein A [Thioclava sp. NG1]
MDDMGRDRAKMNVLTATDAGLIGCTRCGRVWTPDHAHCERCGATLHKVDKTGLQRVWAWWFAGLIFYIPANLYPMLVTATLGHEQKNTIVGGAIELWRHHNYGVALIVFGASVMIPIGKFIAIAYLAIAVGNERRKGGHPHLHLYEVVEFIGRWSMIDVFVVAILSALVQLGFVASIHPGPAAASFALSVAFTMLSAQSFDPRLIWRGPDRVSS